MSRSYPRTTKPDPIPLGVATRVMLPASNRTIRTPSKSGVFRQTENACRNWQAFCNQVYKPGSVLTAIYLGGALLRRSSHLLKTVGPTMCLLHGVASDRVYSIGRFRADG